MRFVMFSVRDIASGVFLQPFVARSETDAKRQLSTAFDDPMFLQTPAGKFPQEFEVYVVADFDDDNGQIRSVFPPSLVCRLSDLRPVPPSSTVPS